MTDGSSWDKTCSECGKVFYLPYVTEYTYKIKHYSETRYFCSYSCYLKGKEKKGHGKKAVKGKG